MELETKTIEGNSREITQAFNDFLREFDAFKQANDERLAQMEKRSADVVTEEKVDRINRALEDQKRALDALALEAARPIVVGSHDAGRKTAPYQTRERTAAFDRYVRKGDA